MKEKELKALFVNGGPRKNKNTAQMLESAMQGAKDAGAEVELVPDYSRYAMTVFKEEDKRKYRDEHFDTDLKNAYELGKRLVGKCQEG